MDLWCSRVNMSNPRKRTMLKTQSNINILNNSVEEKNVVVLVNDYGISKSNISQIKHNKDNILHCNSKLISKNGQKNSRAPAIKSTGNVKVHNISYNIVINLNQLSLR